MAPDVLRHRLVLSYEALAQNLTSRPPARPHPRHRARAPHRAVASPPARSGPAIGTHRTRESRRERRPGRRRRPTSRRRRHDRLPAGVAWRAGEVLRRLELDGHPPPRRAAARRLPRPRPGPRHRAGRDPRVRARRRRAPHRLERHRPHTASPRPRDHRRPRAGDVVAGRPVGQPRLRHRLAREARLAIGRRRRGDGLPHGPRRQPARRRARRRRDHPAATVLPRAAGATTSAPCSTACSPRRAPTAVGRPISRPPSTGSRGRCDRRGLAVVMSDWLDGTSCRGGGSAPAAPWEPALRRSGCATRCCASKSSTHRELELPDVGVIELVDPETGQRHEVQTGNADLRARYAAAAADPARRARPRHSAARAPTTSCCAPIATGSATSSRSSPLDRARMAALARPGRERP